MNAGQRRVVLLSAVTALDTASPPMDISAYRCNTVYFKSAGTTSSGVITIEEADWDPLIEAPFGGTWTSITTVNASAFTAGASAAYHIAAPGAYAFLRVRVSTVIGGGGTISASLRSA